jgi:O-antigen ligase
MTTESGADPPERWPAVAVGVYASAVALAPSIPLKLALVAPAGLFLIAWWIFRFPSRWVAALIVTALLAPPLPLPLGDSGPHPAVLIAGFGLVVGACRFQHWRPQPDFLSAAMVAYFAVLTASVALAAIYSGVGIAAGSLARVALFGISLYVYFDVSGGPGAAARTDPVKLLLKTGMAAAAFACVDFYWQLPAPAGFGPQYVWLESGVYRRAQGLFYEASTLGNFLVFLLVMIAASLLWKDRVRTVSRGWLAAGAAVFFVTLMLTYSRASLVNLAVALGALAWCARGRVRLLRLFLALPLILGAAGWAAQALLPEFAWAWRARLAASAEYLLSATESVLSGRVDTWRSLAAFLWERPWHLIFGVGYKTLPYSDFTGRPVIADNAYLSALVETGVVGLAALLALNFAILRACRRSARDSDPERSFLGAWMFSFWAGQMVQMLSGDLLTYWRVLPAYFWVLALAVGRRERPAR